MGSHLRDAGFLTVVPDQAFYLSVGDGEQSLAGEPGLMISQEASHVHRQFDFPSREGEFSRVLLPFQFQNFVGFCPRFSHQPEEETVSVSGDLGE